MGRHAAPAAFDAQPDLPPVRADLWSPENPVTDPRLFDASLPATPLAPARTAVLERPTLGVPAPPLPVRVGPPLQAPDPGLAATPVVGEHQRRANARPVAPQIPPQPRIQAPSEPAARFTAGPLPIAPRLVAASLTTAPQPVLAPARALATPPEGLPSALSRGRSVSLAVCAVAVLGAVSAAAVLLPNQRSVAQAEDIGTAPGTTTAPLPTARPTAAGHASHKTHPVHPTRGLHRAPGHRVSAQLTESTPASAHASRAISASADPSVSATRSAPSTPAATRSSAPSRATAYTPPSGTTALRNIVSGVPGGRSISLGAGTYSFSDFAGTIGVSLPGGLTGAGEDKTILEMTPHSSTKGGLVPTGSGTTNPLILLEANGGSPLLKDFTLQGTAQGHLYNGLRVKRATNARVENVRVRAIPGNSRVNPGETFGISDFRSTGSVYRGVEVDGAGVGASALGLNNSSSTTVVDSYFHDNPYSAGIAAWQSSDLTITDVTTRNNRTGLNFERTSGTVKIVRPTIENNSAQDLYVGSDQGSAKITIIDPKFSGRLRIRIPTDYWAGTNRQRKSDIRVIINGVDKTSSVVQWL